MQQSTTRPPRKAQPALEGLEERQLLATAAVPDASHLADQVRSLNRAHGISLQDRRVSYTTPDGTRVLVTLYGLGSLAGTTVDPDGALNLVFSRTNADTGIIGKVSGGSRHVPLRSIRHKDLSIQDLSGINSSTLNVVNLKDFDLVDGGRINLTGGVRSLILNSTGRNTQVNVRTLPTQVNSATAGSNTTNGVTLGFVLDVAGAQTLTSVGGQFIPGFNLLAANTLNTQRTSGVNPGPPPAPPGFVGIIKHINGAPRQTTGLENPQIFGYDPTANALIRFDATTGARLQTIPVTGMGTPIAGVGLARDHGRLVALVGDGSIISAYDAVDGGLVGRFATTNLAPLGLTTVDGIGSTDSRTVISDSSAGAGGLALLIDVTASLDAGHAVAVGQPFAPQREFSLSGGLTGVPASHTVYSTGAAHFDTFQPNAVQFGIIALDTTGGQLRETARTALRLGGSFQDVPAPPAPTQALGSVDGKLALITGVAAGKNTMTLLNPQSLATQGTVSLDDPNRLGGLSESFRPDLVDAALIDVQGGVQSLRANDAEGLVFNAAGPINLVKIHRASDSLIIGQPFGHAEIPLRSNVSIISSPRPVGDRNGVTQVDNLGQVGPLSLPS